MCSKVSKVVKDNYQQFHSCVGYRGLKHMSLRHKISSPSLRPGRAIVVILSGGAQNIGGGSGEGLYP